MYEDVLPQTQLRSDAAGPVGVVPSHRCYGSRQRLGMRVISIGGTQGGTLRRCPLSWPLSSLYFSAFVVCVLRHQTKGYELKAESTVKRRHWRHCGQASNPNELVASRVSGSTNKLLGVTLDDSLHAQQHEANGKTLKARGQRPCAASTERAVHAPPG